ncbi:hypothetical protein BH11PSE9_BH11PSE9_36410 [soil metagenome]
MNPEFEQAGLQVFERGWLSSNSVLFAGDKDHPSVLVDSGYASHADQTVALVRAALGGRQLDRIVNTHLHSDHCGGNHALQTVFDCEVLVPAAEAAKVDAWDEDALTYQATGQNCPRFRRTGVVQADSWVSCGELKWQALGAPGHDPASLVLYQPDSRLLISADALWENGFGVVFPELEGIQAFEDVRTTLELLASLDVRCVIPGHGTPFGHIGAALERAFRRLDSFVRDPVRHARYAAKVLVKFHILEHQQQSIDALNSWINGTPYFETIRELYFGAEIFDVWRHGLLEELVKGGALRVENSMIYNV